MAGGINRPLLPTVGEKPDEQRLRTGLGALVRSVLDSGAFLSRLVPGEIRRVPPSPTGLMAVAQFGAMNRAALEPEFTFALPAPRSTQIGVPLSVTKGNPTGVVHVRPTVGADGRTAALLDGSATGITISRPGRTDFTSDGTDWFSNLSEQSLRSARLPVRTISGIALNLDRGHLFSYLRFTNASGCIVTSDATAGFAAGDWTIMRQVATGAIRFAGTATMIAPFTKAASSAEMGATIAAVWSSGTSADLMGELADG